MRGRGPLRDKVAGLERSRWQFVRLGAMSVLAAPAIGQEVVHKAGAPRSRYGERSSFEKAGRYFNPGSYGGTGSARTPLKDLYGIITPSSLFFERVHARVPSIDPAQHQLLIDGLVDTRLLFSMKDLERMPSVSRVHFIECAGNSGSEHAGEPRDTPQKSHGLISCAEWTGVSLSTLLEKVGMKPRAKWVYAEGADACRLARSIPLEKANGIVPGPILRLNEGTPIAIDVFNHSDTSDIVHWHGLAIDSLNDGAMEEGSPMIPPGGRLRHSFTPMPRGTRWITPMQAPGRTCPTPGQHCSTATSNCTWMAVSCS